MTSRLRLNLPCLWKDSFQPDHDWWKCERDDLEQNLKKYYEGKIKKCEDERNYLEQQLEACIMDRGILEQESETNADEIYDLENELEECKDEIEHLEETLIKCIDEKNFFKHEFSLSEDELQRTKRLLSEKYVENRYYKEKVRYLETRQLQKESVERIKPNRRELLNREIENKENKICELESRLNYVSMKLKRAENELHETRNERDLQLNANNQIRFHLGKEIEIKDLKIERLEREIDSLENKTSYTLQCFIDRSNKFCVVNDQSEEPFSNLPEKEFVLGRAKSDRNQTFERNDERDRLQIRPLEEGQKSENKMLEKLIQDKKRTDLENDNLREELKEKERALRQLKEQIRKGNQTIKDLEGMISKMKNANHKETALIIGITDREENPDQKDHPQKDIARFKRLESQLNKALSNRDTERKRIKELERKLRESEIKNKEQELENDKMAKLQEENIEKLKMDLRQCNSIKDDVTGRIAKGPAEAEKGKELTQDIRKKENLLSEQRILLQKVQSKLEDTEAKLKNMASERDTERRSNQLLGDEVKASKMKIKHLEQANDLTAKEQTKKIKQLQGDLENRNKKVKELEEMLRNRKTEGLIREDFGSASSQKEKLLSKLEDQLNQALIKLKRTETELEETKTRLSKALGDKLTDNNPNVADLSDKNRPVKLAERYGELYDNQWTDAFEILNKYYDNEENTIVALLEILKDVMGFCNSTGSKQMKDLQSILGFSGIPVEDIPTDVRKHLKDCRKAMGLITVRNLYQEYLSHLKRSAHEKLKKATEVPAYVRECLELCWLMVIQDPPVVLAPVAKQGSRLNIDLFKPYTRTGPFVEFTVWPALLLHDGGPVLAKGVAQGVGT